MTIFGIGPVQVLILDQKPQILTLTKCYKNTLNQLFVKQHNAPKIM